jgi:hypothetical protein
MATFPIDSSEGMCEPFPRQALVDFPADGAFITLREKVNGIASVEFIVRRVHRPARVFQSRNPPIRTSGG